MTGLIASLDDDQCRALLMVSERPRRDAQIERDLPDVFGGPGALARGTEALTWLVTAGLAVRPAVDAGLWSLTPAGSSLLAQVQSRLGGQ